MFPFELWFLYQTARIMKYLCTVLFASMVLSLPAQQASLQADEDNGLVSVHVTDYKNNVRVGEEIRFYGTVTKKTYSGITDNRGNFDIKLPKGDTYQIKIAAIGEEQKYSTLNIPNEPGMYSGEMAIKFEMPTEITLKDVLFETGSAKLNPSSYKSLDEMANFMKRKITMVIEIAGHTDNLGSKESNLTLSQKRAETVRAYLISKGISAARISAKGYGQDEPVADNETETGRKQNRRTEVKIVKE